MFLRKKKTEKRAAQRADVPVEARIVGENAGYRQVMDIHERGLRMTSDELIETGEWVPVSLRFPSLERELFLLGRVAWTDETGEFGLDLHALPPTQTRQLAGLIVRQESLADLLPYG